MHLVKQRNKKHNSVTVRIMGSKRFGSKVRKISFKTIGTGKVGSDHLATLVKLGRAEVAKLNRKAATKALFDDFDNDLNLRAAALAERAHVRSLPGVKDMITLHGREVFTVGAYEVGRGLLRRHGLDAVWTARHTVSKDVFEEAVLMRLQSAGKSKLGTSIELARTGAKYLPVEQLYRMMDQLDATRIERLKDRIAAATCDLFPHAPTVAFMDVTTLRFASEDEDELRRKGRSKDHRPDKTQVVLALVQTAAGMPLTYELFPGNTADVSTLHQMVGALRRRFPIERAVVVADAGNLSRKNYAALAAAGMDYVIAARVRKLPKAVRGRIAAWVQEGAADYLDIEHGGRRLILQRREARVYRDKKHRTKIVANLAEGLKRSGEAPIPYVKKRYLERTDTTLPTHQLSAAKIKEDAVLDGVHGVFTSFGRDEKTAAEIRTHYSELWQIEQGFLVFKHTLKVRPVFHWTPRRIKAHIAICYTAFAVLRILRWHCRELPCRPAEERLLGALDMALISVNEDTANGIRYCISYYLDPLAKDIYRAVDMEPHAITTALPPLKK